MVAVKTRGLYIHYRVGYSREDWHSSECSPMYDDSTSYHENGIAFCVRSEQQMKKGRVIILLFEKTGTCTFRWDETFPWGLRLCSGFMIRKFDAFLSCYLTFFSKNCPDGL